MHFIKKPLTLISLISLIIIVSCNDDDNTTNTYTDIDREILQLINQYRTSKNLNRLTMDATLFNEAKHHTEYMIKKGNISHDNSKERFLRLQNEIGSKAFAENVASGQRTANEVVQAWLNSKGHRENIEGNFSKTGISAIRNQEGRYYYTQIFTD